MYKNLLHEFNRNSIDINAVAQKLGISKEILLDKINGKLDFEIDECLELQSILKSKSKEISLEYLFEK